MGVADTAAFEQRAELEWFPRLRERYPRHRYEEGTSDAAVVNQIHTPLTMSADILDEYPAHLHIDLVPRLQGRGLGRRLMTQLFSQLRDAGAGGLHLGVSPLNANAIAFYRHLGFEDLAGGFIWGRSTESL